MKMTKHWSIFVVLAILSQCASGLYFHIGDTEKKCFIEEIPDDTTVLSESIYANFQIPRQCTCFFYKILNLTSKNSNVDLRMFFCILLFCFENCFKSDFRNLKKKNSQSTRLSRCLSRFSYQTRLLIRKKSSLSTLRGNFNPNRLIPTVRKF